jgi:hypothetical protein
MLLACAASLPAAEPVAEFLEALRGARYYDMAAEYLARVADSPDVDEEFKRRFDYELGSVLIEAARNENDSQARDRLWGQGLERLRKFVASSDDEKTVATANSKLANALLDRGRAVAARADRSRDKEKLRQEARAMFLEAAGVLESVEKHYVAQFETQGKGAVREERNRLGAPILSTRLAIGEAKSEVAKTYDRGSPEAKKALQQGIDHYKALYQKYSDEGFGAAFVARVNEARNLFEMDKPDDALTRLNDVLELDAGDQGLRDAVLTPAYLLALKAWHKKGDFQSAIDKGSKYAANPRGAEEKRPEWLEMQYLLAAAYQQEAEKLTEGDANRKEYEVEARKLAADVVKSRSDVQNDARQLLGKLGQSIDEQEEGDPKTFAEAIEAATAAMQEYTAARMAIDTAAGSDKTAESDKAALDELKKQLSETRDMAYRRSRQSLALADDKSDPVQLNTARFYLCYLHWEYGQAESQANNGSSHYFDAAVLGDFLAHRFPAHANARQAMAITLASYQKIRQESADEARNAGVAAGKRNDEVRDAVDAAAAPWSDKIYELAQYALSKWPDAQESQSAVAVMASVAVERQEYDQAIQFIDKLKPDSPQRAETELRIGRSLWADYMRVKKDLDSQADTRAENSQTATNDASSQRTATDNGNGAVGSPNKNGTSRPTDESLKQLAENAQRLLESSLTRAKASGPIDRNVVLGLWALVQSYVSTSQPQKAIPWLEDEKLGLLTLVNNKHEAAEVEGLLFDAYRLALRTYIAVKPQQLEKAIATMDALEKITGDDVKGREMLTTVYIAMGRDLQREINELVAAGRTGEVESLSTAFEAFLKRLVARDSGNTFNSLFWVADTYTGLGAGLAQGGEKSPAEIKRSEEYFRQAVAAFEKIRELAKSDKNFMPEKYQPLVEMRLAKAYRGAGEHNKALALLVRVLKEKPSMIEAQFDAAYTYQEYAESDRATRGKYFRHAILGGQTGDYSKIWGWNLLAERIRDHETRLRREGDDPLKLEQAEQYRQRYQEARYNSVYCKVALAELEQDAAKKKKLLEGARRDMYLLYSLVDPQFGGGSWKAKNEKLLKNVQSALAEPTIGFKEFEKKQEEQPATNAAAVR